MNSWLILILAGLCEVVWALGLKLSNGLTLLRPTIVTVVFMVLSVYLLAVAVRSMPVSLAYSIWVGIGAVGAFVGGIVVFHEKTNLMQILFLVLIVAGIIGLKLYSTE